MLRKRISIQLLLINAIFVGIGLAIIFALHNQLQLKADGVNKETVVNIQSVKPDDKIQENDPVKILGVHTNRGLLKSTTYIATIQNKDGVISDIQIDYDNLVYKEYANNGKAIPISFLTGKPYIGATIKGSYKNVHGKTVKLDKKTNLNYFEYKDLTEKISKHEPIKYVKLF